VAFNHYLFDLAQKAGLTSADLGEILLCHPPEQLLEPRSGVYLAGSLAEALVGATAAIS
jgi:hypothetical protein